MKQQARRRWRVGDLPPGDVRYVVGENGTFSRQVVDGEFVWFKVDRDLRGRLHAHSRPWHALLAAEGFVDEVPEAELPALVDGMPLVLDVVDQADTGPLSPLDMRVETLRRIMADVLKGWINGGAENHDAHGHKGPIDDCCWQFAPADIRRMFDDILRELPRVSRDVIDQARKGAS